MLNFYSKFWTNAILRIKSLCFGHLLTVNMFAYNKNMIPDFIVKYLFKFSLIE